MAQAEATLRQVVVRKGLVADALLVAGGALLVAAAAQIRIPLPFTPVPITGQTFAVLLVGASLGSTRGGMSLLLYLALGAAGLPFYSGATGGWEIVRGATGGYLMGFVAAAVVTGALAERGWDRRFRSALGAMLTGNVIVYLAGLPWLAAVTGGGLEKSLELGLLPFIPGDVLKLYLASAVLPLAWRLVGRDKSS
jgi:biotin transport system substrate-specific component